MTDFVHISAARMPVPTTAMRFFTAVRAKMPTGMDEASMIPATKVPVVPMGIKNTFHILPKGKLIPKKGKAILRIGKPLYFDKYYGKENDKYIIRKVTTIIMNEIARLSEQQYDYDQEYLR